MDLYINIIKLFLRYETWKTYNQYIDEDFLRKNYPELNKLFYALRELHNKNKTDGTLPDLQAAFFTAYPNADPEVYEALFNRVLAAEANPENVIGYLDSIASKAQAIALAFIALDVSEGKQDVSKLEAAIADYGKTKAVLASFDSFANDDLEVLYERAVAGGGLKWRLKCLNRSLGPLRKGDFGYIFARPETGKTTFLASEVGYMSQTMTDPVLWFNNEEQNDKVLLRCYESVLGLPLEVLKKDRIKYRDEFYARTGRRIKLVDATALYKKEIEGIIESIKPGLIVFDQLDKVKGFAADRDDLVLGEIYIWARELAKAYCPVIGVSQADGTAENIKYLNMGHCANAKTSKQAEADWILGIGVSHGDVRNVRGFSICKNKLVGGEESIPEARHAKYEVLIDPEIGRYVDVLHS